MGDTTAASRHGVRRLPGGLPDRERRALIEEAEGLAFTAPHPRAGGWFAGVDLAVPRVGDAVRLLTDAAAAHGLGFAPNEASFQRYDPGGNGLPPHRDQRYYVGCIAIVTLLGAATFALHDGREQVAEEWTTTPGEVVLLPGWRPGTDDPRPWHRVDPPASAPRLMFQLRRLAAPDSPEWSPEFSAAERAQATELLGPPDRRGLRAPGAGAAVRARPTSASRNSAPPSPSTSPSRRRD